MSALSLTVEFGGARIPALEALSRMHAALAHRGPAEGWLLVGAGLEARRSRAAPAGAAPPLRVAAAFRASPRPDMGDDPGQPLAAPDGRQWILLDGCLYNGMELREALRARGLGIPGASDAQVALAAYRVWGLTCFERFHGEWAILLVDLARGRLVGSRDRLGIKPLYYAVEPGRLLLASEPKALAAGQAAGPSVEAVRFLEFLRGAPPQSAGLSFFRGIHPVPAASVFEIDVAGGAARMPAFRAFWNLADFRPEPGAIPSFEDARAAFTEALQSAVRTQAAGAGDVGCFLSGGLDSSTIACTLAAQRAAASGPAPKVYSLLLDEGESPEWSYIRAVVERAGLDSRTHVFTPAHAWATLDEVIRAQGEPLLGHDVIAHYHGHRLAREHGSTVVLEGEGADELLAGMPVCEAMALRELLASFEPRAFLAELRCLARRQRRSPLAILQSHLVRPLLRPVAAGLRRRRYAWLADGGETASRSDDVGDGSTDPSPLNRYLYRLVKHTNVPTVLAYLDRNASAHGIAARAPFLDHRLVELCFRLPASYKVRFGERKRILLASARGLVPDAVVNRSEKRAFLWRQDWMPLRRDYADELREMARSRMICESPYVRGAAVAAFVEDYLRARHDDSYAVWRLHTAWRWLEIVREGTTRC